MTRSQADRAAALFCIRKQFDINVQTPSPLTTQVMKGQVAGLDEYVNFIGEVRECGRMPPSTASWGRDPSPCATDSQESLESADGRAVSIADEAV